MEFSGWRIHCFQMRQRFCGCCRRVWVSSASFTEHFAHWHRRISNGWLHTVPYRTWDLCVGCRDDDNRLYQRRDVYDDRAWNHQCGVILYRRRNYDRAHHRELSRFGGIANAMPVYFGLRQCHIFSQPRIAGAGADLWERFWFCWALSPPAERAKFFTTGHHKPAIWIH